MNHTRENIVFCECFTTQIMITIEGEPLNSMHRTVDCIQTAANMQQNVAHTLRYQLPRQPTLKRDI